MLVKRNSVGLESRKQRDVIYMFVCITCGVEMVKDREAWCSAVQDNDKNVYL